ncbi:MAG TPA: trehalase family glycosidase [Acidisarcina sp.]|nr:trehalase family glycosidase [Acidisarcina sp.]
MRHSLRFLLVGIVAVSLSQPLYPQSVLAPPAAEAPRKTVEDAALLDYIQKAWDTLSRSMSDCNSLVDPKVTTTPILYLPAGMETPSDVVAMQQHCKVDVEHLPNKITHMGDVSVSSIPRPGLLYLPNRYVVPGGRFNEMYGWDSFFIIRGLVDDGRAGLAHGMVENFFFEIENYGAILNANRTYFFTRSQPPLLSSMIQAVYDAENKKDAPKAKAWLQRAYGYAERDYSLWTHEPHLAGKTGLARYTDIGAGPVPEMADDSQYYPDVIRWLVAHPDVHTDYLLRAPEDPTAEQAETLARSSCDVRTSSVCAHAYADGNRLTANFYAGDRAMRESGFDPSFRFGPFSGSTENYAPICLNSLLYKYELDMARFARLLGKSSDQSKWLARARARHAAVNRYLWNPAKGMYYDYDFVAGKQSTYNYITAFYPLWAGLASKQQAAQVEKHLSVFEHAGGLAMSDHDSGLQWDLPFGWAPTNWFAVEGLATAGYYADAARVSREFMQMVRQNFERDKTVREKYNVVTGSTTVNLSAGYRSNVVGFGWTNATYLEMKQLLSARGAHAATAAAH